MYAIKVKNQKARYYSLDKTSSVDASAPHNLLSFTFLEPRNVNQRDSFSRFLCMPYKYSATYIIQADHDF